MIYFGTLVLFPEPPYENIQLDERISSLQANEQLYEKKEYILILVFYSPNLSENIKQKFKQKNAYQKTFECFDAKFGQFKFISFKK